MAGSGICLPLLLGISLSSGGSGVFLSLLLDSMVKLPFPCYRKQRTFCALIPHLTQPSQPAGRKSMHTGSFLFHWPEELSTIGSSISLLRNLHPQQNLVRISLRTWEIGLHDFANPVVKRLVSKTPETRIIETPMRFKVNFSTTLHSIRILDFTISRILMLMQRFQDFTPRNPEMVNKIDFRVDSAPPVHPAAFYGPHDPFGPLGLRTS
jgi:hypothetical protein